MKMQGSTRARSPRIDCRSARLLLPLVVSLALTVTDTGCKRHNISQPSGSPTTTESAAPSPPAQTTPATSEAPVDSEPTRALADFKSTSPFYPQEEVLKVAIDNVTLFEPSEYQDLMSALVRFLDTAAETEYPEQTPVARPAIKLDTAAGRYSYMLVPGDPAIKCYLPDKYMPWLYGDQAAYDELISTLDKLYGTPLPRERP